MNWRAARYYPYTIFVTVILLIFAAALVSIGVEWRKCSTDGGTLVRAMSWNAYACIEDDT